MALEIVAYRPEMRSMVVEFNRRMQEGESTWRWYEDSIPDWLPKLPDQYQKVWREYHLAVEDGSTVRGAYCLKPQEFLIRKEPRFLGSWQGPVSEGIINQKYSALAFYMMRDMLDKQPQLFCWGATDRMCEILKTLGWLRHETPLCLRILKPSRFLRRNQLLRGTPLRRLALDALAFTGLGWCGILSFHAAQSSRHGRPPTADAEAVDGFAGWADEVWERSQDRYTMIAVRDGATMDALLPRGSWPPAIRLRISEHSQIIGWAAVLDSQMSNDRRFGSLRVGTIIDCLAVPEDALKVVGAAFQFLRNRGVDIVCSHQSHAAWIKAFAASGFAIVPNIRMFAASEALADELQPFDDLKAGMHLTAIDGDGPLGL